MPRDSDIIMVRFNQFQNKTNELKNKLWRSTVDHIDKQLTKLEVLDHLGESIAF